MGGGTGNRKWHLSSAVGAWGEGSGSGRRPRGSPGPDPVRAFPSSAGPCALGFRVRVSPVTSQQCHSFGQGRDFPETVGGEGCDARIKDSRGWRSERLSGVFSGRWYAACAPGTGSTATGPGWQRPGSAAPQSEEGTRVHVRGVLREQGPPGGVAANGKGLIPGMWPWEGTRLCCSDCVCFPDPQVRPLLSSQPAGRGARERPPRGRPGPWRWGGAEPEEPGSP